MARTDNLNNFLTDVADSIRSKKQTTGKVNANDFDVEIDSIASKPTKGFFLDEFNSDGRPTKLEVIGMTGLPVYCCSNIYNVSVQINGRYDQGFFRDLKTVQLDSKCMYLNSFCFQNCVKLTNINTKLIKRVYFNSFNNCQSLVSLDLSNVEYIGSIGYGTSTGYAFNGCKNLERLILPDSYNLVGNGNFNGCSKLNLDKIPSNMTTIPNNTFSGCSSLTLNKLPEALTSIGSSAFENCSNLAITSLPESITTIKDNAFRKCSNITLDKLPDSLTSIGTYAFESDSLITISKIPDGVKVLGSCVFSGCNNIKKISALNVTEIASYNSTYGAFYNCTGLKQVWIGSSISNSKIYRYSFKGCTNLEKIYINLPRETVESFTSYQYAFMDDTSKTNIIVCNDDEGFITIEEFDALEV